MFYTHVDNRDYYESLPKKRIGVSVLIFYKQQLLILKPTYIRENIDDPHPRIWILPSGTIETEESPIECIQRETLRLLQIPISITQLLVVDYMRNHDSRGEFIQFVFEAAPLGEEIALKIKTLPDETKDFKFVDVEKALGMLTICSARRLESTMLALQQNLRLIYLEDGILPDFKQEIALS